ncbi:MAG TPA: aldo/keto reductase [Tepidisphaeraceae bacterium]|jgi:predicted aldo/keto reductase-like oxidoreductase|nr:aldo/keto reductase [Tepidisphaeraceae bacterium]
MSDLQSSMNDQRNPVRREFLRSAAAAGLGLATGGAVEKTATPPPATPERPGAPTGDPIPLRQFGRADVKVSALGMGGHHLGDFKTIEEAIAAVHEAIDGGITFFDNCWEYHNGKSENWLGRALLGRRDKVFLMTKVCTHGRSAELAMEMLEQSLIRLQTDHLDLWQIHGVTFDNDPELAYRKGGVIEALEQAKKAGKVRFVGFTGHKDPAIHLKMIQMGYPFDAVQMPLNPFDGNFHSFERQVIPEARKRGFAVLGMKPMNGTAEAIKKGVFKPEEMLRYAMSLPVTTTIAGIDTLDVLRQNLKVAQGFTPMAAAEMDDLRKRCADAAGDGRFELYKMSLKYDNPQAREPHHFPLDPTIKEVKDMFKGVMSASP